MTEDKKHQLDELSVTDILSYLGTRVANTEEHIRRADKQLTEAKEIIKIMKHLLFDVWGYIAIPLEKRVNDFLRSRV